MTVKGLMNQLSTYDENMQVGYIEIMNRIFLNGGQWTMSRF